MELNSHRRVFQLNSACKYWAISSVIEKIADARAENGAEQNRVLQAIDLLKTNLTNMEAALWQDCRY